MHCGVVVAAGSGRAAADAPKPCRRGAGKDATAEATVEAAAIAYAACGHGYSHSYTQGGMETSSVGISVAIPTSVVECTAADWSSSGGHSSDSFSFGPGYPLPVYDSSVGGGGCVTLEGEHTAALPTTATAAVQAALGRQRSRQAAEDGSGRDVAGFAGGGGRLSAAIAGPAFSRQRNRYDAPASPSVIPCNVRDMYGYPGACGFPCVRAVLKLCRNIANLSRPTTLAVVASYHINITLPYRYPQVMRCVKRDSRCPQNWQLGSFFFVRPLDSDTILHFITNQYYYTPL